MSATTSSLYTTRLELRPGTATVLRAELAGHPELARALDAQIPPDWPPDLYDTDAVRYTLASIGHQEDGGVFGFYYVLLRPDADPTTHAAMLVGVGGFKGAPDPAVGQVELGYGIAASYQRRGFASEAVEAWVRRAFKEPVVRAVVAQTLDTLVPSIGVLEKTGFRFVGAGEDPGAPPGTRVIRYELTRIAHEVRTRQPLR